jgi:hypothetical protein
MFVSKLILQSKFHIFASSLVFDTTWIHDYEVEEYLATGDLLKSLLSAKSAEARGNDLRREAPPKSMVDLRLSPWTETNLWGDGATHPQ